jgi:hypothetical protein
MGLNIANIEPEAEQEFRQWCEKKGITHTTGINQLIKEKFENEQEKQNNKQELYIKTTKNWYEFLNNYQKLIELAEQEKFEQNIKKDKKEYQEKIQEIDEKIRKWKTQDLLQEINYLEYTKNIEKLKKELIIYCKEKDIRLGEILELSTQKKELTQT